MLLRTWSHRNSHSLLLGLQSGTDTLEDSLVAAFKTNILLPYNPAITLRGIYPNGLKPNPHKNLHMDA